MAKHPPLTPIRSSWLSGYSYDPNTRALHVSTQSGKVYVARGVSMERATAFAENLSKGGYWNDQIRGNHIIDEVIGE